MKLILENWREYLNEDSSQFGEKFEEFKHAVTVGREGRHGQLSTGGPVYSTKPEHPVKVADEILTKIGEGATRLVYGFPDNPHQLLKIINVEIVGDVEEYPSDWQDPKTKFTKAHKLNSNEWEANLAMQQKYPGIFPRSYDRAKDYSWILVERVNPINNQKMFEELNIADEEELLQEVNNKEYDRWEKIIGNAVRYALRQTTTHGWESIYGPRGRITETFKPDKPIVWSTKASEDDPLITPPPIVQKMLSKQHNVRLFSAMGELNIPLFDFKAKNLGISTMDDPHLVLLDASLWEELE